MTSAIIPFPLDQLHSETTLVYRPWGIRTLKVVVSTRQGQPALRIRPKTTRPEDKKAQVIRGFADNSAAFVLSWGGGHDEGPCLKAKDLLKVIETCAPMTPEAGQEETSILFFNLRHIGPDVPDDAAITLEAYHEDSGQTQSAVTIQLQKPDGYTAESIQFTTTQPGLWQPRGSRIAQYDSRWWPGPVSYRPAGELPLSIQRDGAILRVYWQDEEAAHITDNAKPLVLDMDDAFAFELFHFDKWHVALRVWFFWLDMQIGQKHEVPDAERFDMLIRRSDGVVTLACTDMHWREIWGEVVGAPLRATVGNSREAIYNAVKDSAQEELRKLWAVIKGEKKQKRSHNPITRDISGRAELLGTDKVRKPGPESHLPMLDNITQVDPVRWTSSDVRLG